MMLISQSDDHRPADVGETEAEVAEGEAEPELQNVTDMADISV